MKENPRRYINPFLSDEENEKVDFWNNQQVEKVTVDDHFTTTLEDEKMEKTLAAAPSNVPSEKANELAYVDKDVTACQVPKLIARYEESGFHVVKDICVDEGVSVSSYEEEKKKIEIDKLSFNLITTVNGDIRVKDGIGTDRFSKHQQLTPLEDCYNNDTCLFSVTKNDNVPSNCASDKFKLFVEWHIVHDSKTYNLIQNCEGKSDQNSNSLNNSSTHKLVSLNQDPRQTSINVLEPEPFVNHVDQQLSETRSTGPEADEERRSSSSQGVCILNEIKMERNTTSLSDNVKQATMNSLVELPPSGPNHHDMGSVVENQLQRGAGESSFSTVSGLITYSGPIASCGNMSHRSDGSNSSVRSFAFPILQNEWSSSPVRMGEVDQRRPRKHGGWRQALMCCRF